MDELDIQGKKYISSKRASELTGYAKDYVGQLARAKKVPATRVGRAWYVELDAILKHAGSEALTVEEHVSPSIQSQKHPIQEETLYSLHDLRTKGVYKDQFKTWNSIKYSHEDSELFPLVKEKEQSIHIPVTKKYTALESKVSSFGRGMQPSTVDGIAVARPTALKKESVQKQQKNEQKLLLSPQYALLGSALGVLVASVAILTGLYTPSEWSFSVAGSQIASGGELEGEFSLIFEFFNQIFLGGITLINDFFSIFLDSLVSFFEIGLVFLLNLF